MEAYLDNAATTRPFPSVVECMVKTMTEDYGNPSSMHQKGMDAEQYIKEAAGVIAKSMKVDAKEIVFTSGGTEANNQALIGAAYANRRAGNHIITTRIEHASVYNPLIYLEEQGFRVTYLPVDANGRVNPDTLREAVCADTILVSVMYVNNEIGAVEDIETLVKVAKEKNPAVIFHVDAIQAYGKYKIYPKRLGIDLLSVSGHKIHGPKGNGFLYIRDKAKVKPLIYGGGQQKDRRSGTENVPGIAGLGEAVRMMYEDHEDKIMHLYECKKALMERANAMEGVTVNGVKDIPLEETAPHIVSVSVDGIRSEVLLHALEDKGVYVSSGSACSSNHPQISGTLQAIGVKKELLDSTIRFSMSVSTTLEEIAYAMDCMEQLLPMLRRYRRH